MARKKLHKIQGTMQTKKKEPNRTQMTLEGTLINYPDGIGPPPANLLIIKTFLKSVIFILCARFATSDISIFYLLNTLLRPEFAKA